MNYAYQSSDKLFKGKKRGDSQHKLLWSDEYLIFIEENFEKIFKVIYEEQFIDRIFLTHEARVDREDFVKAIAGDFDEEPKCDWIFNTSKIREIF